MIAAWPAANLQLWLRRTRLHCRKGLSVDDAVLLCKKAIAEIRMRFMVDAGVHICVVVAVVHR
jgi:hypothetical protein|eukprot:COSAG01_NODE_271_length_19794_cov_73.630890_4_plen_63_part_00